MNYEEYKTMAEARLALNIRLLESGVEFIDIERAYIDPAAQIGRGTVIGACVTIEAGTVIGEDCIIGQNTRIKGSTIGRASEIQSSVILDSAIGEETKVGPFAYIRPGSSIGSHCKVGDFVEVKNSSMGDGSKASHLAYIGDSDVGKDVNIGCGVVFVNYDGKRKHRSIVGDGAFIGCNTNLVSPVVVEEGSYIAAGSTVTTNVPKGALFVSRTKGRVIEGWVDRRGLLKKER